MSRRSAPTPSGGVVIPFPRYRCNAPRRAAQSGTTTPDYDAGFEAAMSLLMAMKEAGLLGHRR